MLRMTSFEDANKFLPSQHDAIDYMITDYQKIRKNMEEVSTLMQSKGFKGIEHYFVKGNVDARGGYYSSEKLFDILPAVAVLNSEFWKKALDITDVISLMPQKRKDEWYKQIEEKKCPDFTDDTVRTTIFELLQQRGNFFAEKVEGVFRVLSGSHVTNTPQGFNKRMIIARVIDSLDMIDYSRKGYIHDLRSVIAKLLGRTEPDMNQTYSIIKAAQNDTGQWQCVDGNAIKIRVYKVGTAHIEIHPDVAWQLNKVLATLYPMAIPAKFRQKPEKESKEFEMLNDIIPYAVLAKFNDRNAFDLKTMQYTVRRYHDVDKLIVNRIKEILRHIGGVESSHDVFQFNYDIRNTITEIYHNGYIPNYKSYQFYPTPESIARYVCESAELECGMIVLEPSAGTGNLVDAIAVDDIPVVCVELSDIHCKILESKGYETIQGDFIEVSDRLGMFDRIIMNPPYSLNRADVHVKKALKHLKKDGIMIAVLPLSFRNKEIDSNFDQEVLRTFDNLFDNTVISVIIVKLTRKI